MKHTSLPPPADLPQVDGVAMRDWARGWYAGLIVGCVNGMGLAVLLGWVSR